jgi:outer membrane protein assembly factor BamB
MRKLFCVMAAVAVAGSLAMPAPARAEPAGSVQLNPAHDGQITFSRPFAGPLKRRWSVDLGGTFVYPVFGDGRLFVTVVRQQHSFLDALDAASGALLWEVETQDGRGPAYERGLVFVVDKLGLVQAYSAQDGSLAWSKQQQSGTQPFYFDPPVAAGGTLYFDGIGSSATLYSLDAKTGERRWAFDSTQGESIPAVAGHTVYTSFPCRESALNPKTGKARWTYDTGCSGGGASTTVYFENRLYINEGRNFVVLDAATGTKVGDAPFFKYLPAFWTNPSGHSMGFYVDSHNKLCGFDTVTSQTVWQTGRPRFAIAPLVINGTVVIGTAKGRLFGLDPQTGGVLWSQNLGTAIHAQIAPYTFAAGGNTLFVPSDTKLSAWISR